MWSKYPMWLLFEYEPTTLFSLKTSRATSTVGKTLLTPTPYAPITTSTFFSTPLVVASSSPSGSNGRAS